jgi:tRNA dimethylallyltransferase
VATDLPCYKPPMSASDVSIVIVAGPTGSGKSALALALAEHFSGTIINADSQQVYRDLAVLTARPGRDAMARIPHRLYGVIDAAESCSVGRWLTLAQAEIAATCDAGRLPILVGGTGLYLEALVQGLAPLPPIPEAARAEARRLHAELGATAFRAALAELDPEAAARVAPGDTQRLTRAYEVAKATGVPLSQWQRQHDPAPPLRTAALVLLPPREALYASCDQRVDRMIAAGAEDEVRALLARALAPSLPAMKAVGVRELGAYLAGEISHQNGIAAMQQATRNYAKRQYTWFRRRLPEAGLLKKLVVNEQFSESLCPEIFSFIRQFLLTDQA